MTKVVQTVMLMLYCLLRQLMVFGLSVVRSVVMRMRMY